MAFLASGISDERLKEILHGVKVHCFGSRGNADEKKKGTLEVEGKKVNVRCGRNEVLSLTSFCVAAGDTHHRPKEFIIVSSCSKTLSDYVAEHAEKPGQQAENARPQESKVKGRLGRKISNQIEQSEHKSGDLQASSGEKTNSTARKGEHEEQDAQTGQSRTTRRTPQRTKGRRSDEDNPSFQSQTTLAETRAAEHGLGSERYFDEIEESPAPTAANEDTAEQAHDDHFRAPYTPRCRVQVRFDDGTWYGGVLDGTTRLFRGHRRFRIIFDDGDTAWTDLPANDLRLEDPSPARDDQGSAIAQASNPSKESRKRTTTTNASLQILNETFAMGSSLEDVAVHVTSGGLKVEPTKKGLMVNKNSVWMVKCGRRTISLAEFANCDSDQQPMDTISLVQTGQSLSEVLKLQEADTGAASDLPLCEESAESLAVACTQCGIKREFAARDAENNPSCNQVWKCQTCTAEEASLEKVEDSPTQKTGRKLREQEQESPDAASRRVSRQRPRSESITEDSMKADSMKASHARSGNIVNDSSPSCATEAQQHREEGRSSSPQLQAEINAAVDGDGESVQNEMPNVETALEDDEERGDVVIAYQDGEEESSDEEPPQDTVGRASHGHPRDRSRDVEIANEGIEERSEEGDAMEEEDRENEMDVADLIEERDSAEEEEADEEEDAQDEAEEDDAAPEPQDEEDFVVEARSMREEEEKQEDADWGPDSQAAVLMFEAEEASIEEEEEEEASGGEELQEAVLDDDDEEYEPPAATGKMKRGSKMKALDAAGPSGAGKKERSYKTGDKVSIMDMEDGQWYKGKVLQVYRGKCKVHYIGWSSTWDEWVFTDDTSRLQRGFPTTQPTPAKSKAPSSSTSSRRNSSAVAVAMSAVQEPAVEEYEMEDEEAGEPGPGAKESWVCSADLKTFSNGHHHVGQRVRIRDRDAGVLVGTIEQYDAELGYHAVLMGDEEGQWLQLPDADVDFVQKVAGGSGRSAAFSRVAGLSSYCQGCDRYFGSKQAMHIHIGKNTACKEVMWGAGELDDLLDYTPYARPAPEAMKKKGKKGKPAGKARRGGSASAEPERFFSEKPPKRKASEGAGQQYFDESVGSPTGSVDSSIRSVPQAKKARVAAAQAGDGGGRAGTMAAEKPKSTASTIISEMLSRKATAAAGAKLSAVPPGGAKPIKDALALPRSASEQGVSAGSRQDSSSPLSFASERRWHGSESNASAMPDPLHREPLRGSLARQAIAALLAKRMPEQFHAQQLAMAALASSSC